MLPRTLLAVLLLTSSALAAQRLPIAEPTLRPDAMSFAPFVTTDGDAFLAVWCDDRHGNVDAFAARFDTVGEPIDRASFPLHATAHFDCDASVVWDGQRYLAFAPARDVGTFLLNVTKDAHVENAAAPFPAEIRFERSLAWNGERYSAVMHDSRDGSTSLVLLNHALTVTWRTPLPATDGVIGPARIATDGREFLVVWESASLTSDRVFAQKFNRGGTPAGPLHTLASRPAHEYSPEPYPQLRPAVSWNGTAFTVVWTDATGVNGARISRDTVTPFAVSADADASDVAIAWDGMVYLAVWTSGRFETQGRAAMLTATGDVLESFPLGDPNSLFGPPSVASNGNVFLLLWAGQRFVIRSDSFLRLCQPECVRHDASTAEIYQPQRTPVIGAGATNLLAAWTEPDALYVGRLSNEGKPLDGGGIRVAAGSYYIPVRGLDVVSNGSTYLVVWEEGNANIRGIRMSASGQLLDAAPFDIGRGFSPVVTSRGDSFLVAWTDSTGGWFPVPKTLIVTPVPASGEVQPAKKIVTPMSTHIQIPIALFATDDGYALLWQQNLSDPCFSETCPPLQHEQRLTMLDEDAGFVREQTLLSNQKIQDATLANGAIVALVRDGARIYTHRFSEAGKPLGDRSELPIPVDALKMRITKHGVGFAVLFTTPALETRAILLDASARPLTEPLDILGGDDSPQLGDVVSDGGRVWIAYVARWRPVPQLHEGFIDRSYVASMTASRRRSVR